MPYLSLTGWKWGTVDGTPSCFDFSYRSSTFTVRCFTFSFKVFFARYFPQEPMIFHNFFHFYLILLSFIRLTLFPGNFVWFLHLSIPSLLLSTQSLISPAFFVSPQSMLFLDCPRVEFLRNLGAIRPARTHPCLGFCNQRRVFMRSRRAFTETKPLDPRDLIPSPEPRNLQFLPRLVKAIL